MIVRWFILNWSKVSKNLQFLIQTCPLQFKSRAAFGHKSTIRMQKHNLISNNRPRILIWLNQICYSNREFIYVLQHILRTFRHLLKYILVEAYIGMQLWVRLHTPRVEFIGLHVRKGFSPASDWWPLWQLQLTVVVFNGPQLPPERAGAASEQYDIISVFVNYKYRYVICNVRSESKYNARRRFTLRQEPEGILQFPCHVSTYVHIVWRFEPVGNTSKLWTFKHS